MMNWLRQILCRHHWVRSEVVQGVYKCTKCGKYEGLGGGDWND